MEYVLYARDALDDVCDVQNAPQPPQTPPQIGVNVQAAPDFSAFERPIYIVQEEETSAESANSGSNAASSASRATGENKSTESTTEGKWGAPEKTPEL